MPRFSSSLNLAARAYMWVAKGDSEFLPSLRRSAPRDADLKVADAVAAQIMMRALTTALVCGFGLIHASKFVGEDSLVFYMFRAVAYFLAAFPCIVMATLWLYAFTRPKRRRHAVLLVRTEDAYSYRPFRLISVTGWVGATVFAVITATLEAVY